VAVGTVARPLPRAIAADPYLFQMQILIFPGVAPTRETPFGMVDAASDGKGKVGSTG
jgi:hypothetical protein